MARKNCSITSPAGNKLRRLSASWNRGKPPDEAVIDYLSASLNLPAAKITLLVAPAASMAGNLQVVARSLETALHKLHELKFDLNQVISGSGSAPLPPVAKDELGAIGRTNDAILYGARVMLWVNAEDDALAEIGPKVPASALPDYGAPFANIFTRAGGDFYKIDPMLFSPAEVAVCNLRSGAVSCSARRIRTCCGNRFSYDSDQPFSRRPLARGIVGRPM